MFSKCLKYELRAVWKIICIASAALIGFSIVSSVTVRLLYNAAEKDPEGIVGGIASIVSVLMFFLAVITVSAYLLITAIVCIVRFYKHFFSDEGYLTFTLPVSRGTLYLAKAVNALIWDVASVVSIVISLGIAAVILKPLADMDTFEELVRVFGDIPSYRDLTEAFQRWLVPILLAFVLLLLACAVLSTGFTYFCVTAGSVLAKKHKILAAFGIFYGVNFVSSILGQFLPVAIEIAVMSIGDRLFSLGADRVLPLFFCVILAVFGIVSAIAVTFHMISLGMIEKKLNLE